MTRTYALRTVLVWILLELVAALQIRSPDGIPMLFSWIRSIVEPVVVAAENTAAIIVDFGLGVQGLQQVIVDNRQLRIELEELRAREMLLQTDLDTLREAGNLAGPHAEYAAGSVIARCAYRDLVSGTMEVRTAESVFLARDTPVVAADGLVGRVVRSEGRRHWLQLLTHVAAAVAVQSKDSRLHGLALGTGGDILNVEYVPRQAELERGTLLVTSGSDGIFPPGIPTVRVTRVRESDKPFLEITATSTANLRATHLVLILPNWAPAPGGTAP